MLDSALTTQPGGSVVNHDSEILGGIPVFAGTRVPIHTLIEYLEGDYSIEEFLDNFPSVRRQQVSAFLRESTQALLAQLAAARLAQLAAARMEQAEPDVLVQAA